VTWSQRFRLRESARGSLWIIPLLGAALGAILGAFGSVLDEHVDLPAYWDYSPETASTVLTSIVGATAALTGFVVTVTVLVVQMATGTFSARYMRLWYRSRMLKWSLAVLVGTLTFSFALLRRIEADFVPNFGVTLAGFFVLLSVLLFLFFFDGFIHRLRPVAVAAEVAKSGRAAFDQVVRLADRPDIRWERRATPVEPAFVVRASRAGSIQAIDPDGLVRWAREHDSELVLAHAVGDFVSTGDTLIWVRAATESPDAPRELRGMIALGDERTIEQDPAFAMRIMVDIAIRALSPAVNDPTTAVQVLNHLGELLRLVGSTDLEGRSEPAGSDRPARVVMLARGWEEFLGLGVTEIREYGASSVQVVRRLRAMLEDLREAVLPEHRAAVDDELVRLDASVAARWTDSVDLDLARVADGQGIGGPGTAGAASG
jgi:uncharacterized membrane protein